MREIEQSYAHSSRVGGLDRRIFKLVVFRGMGRERLRSGKNRELRPGSARQPTQGTAHEIESTTAAANGPYRSETAVALAQLLGLMPVMLGAFGQQGRQMSWAGQKHRLELIGGPIPV